MSCLVSLHRILIFNYEQQCAVTEAPTIQQVIQVHCSSFVFPLCWQLLFQQEWNCRLCTASIHGFSWPLPSNFQKACHSQGLKLTFYDSKADILLLEVSATIPDGFKPYKLGYDGMEDAVPKRAVGIHHPNGNFKRISYANSRCAHRNQALVNKPFDIVDMQLDNLICCTCSDSISTSFVARRFPAGEVQPSATTHLQVWHAHPPYLSSLCTPCGSVCLATMPSNKLRMTYR